MNYINRYSDLFDAFSLSATTSILILFLMIVIILIFIALWIFSSYGIQVLANRKKVKNSWLAYLPIGRNYLIAKLGYEVFAPETKKNPTLTWVTLGVSAGCSLLSTVEITGLLEIALIILQTIAFYNIYKVLSKKVTIMTVFTVLFGNIIGGIFLYVIKNNQEIEEMPIETNNTKEADISEKVELKRPNYCPNCGNKISKQAKFCDSCGQKIN